MAANAACLPPPYPFSATAPPPSASSITPSPPHNGSNSNSSSSTHSKSTAHYAKIAADPSCHNNGCSYNNGSAVAHCIKTAADPSSNYLGGGTHSTKTTPAETTAEYPSCINDAVSAKGTANHSCNDNSGSAHYDYVSRNGNGPKVALPIVGNHHFLHGSTSLHYSFPNYGRPNVDAAAAPPSSPRGCQIEPQCESGSSVVESGPRRPCLWYEEEIDESLRWCFGLTSILHAGVSKYQEIALLDTLVFGKVLTLDRKMQSAEKDEWVYHECLVHPALLCHSSPKSVFIMGGGEGSTAREALRHKSVKKVVMCDIDEEVVKFCSTHLTTNKEAFHNPNLELVINDAKAELESRDETFDVIMGDLADPLEWGPCYQLYSKDFYQNIVKPKLNVGGIFVTQAGPAGILSHKEVFTSIYNTLKHVFAYVVAYSAHVPSYADTWGWVMASDEPLNQITVSNEMDARIKQRIEGELQYLDGSTLYASTILNKAIRLSLKNETHVYTEDSARFIYGHGRSANVH